MLRKKKIKYIRNSEATTSLINKQKQEHEPASNIGTTITTRKENSEGKRRTRNG